MVKHPFSIFDPHSNHRSASLSTQAHHIKLQTPTLIVNFPCGIFITSPFRIKHQRVSFVALLSFGGLKLLDHRAWMSVFLQMGFLFPVSVYVDLKGCATVLLALTPKVAPTSCNYFLKSLLNVPNLSWYTNCLHCFSHFHMLTHLLKISFNPSLVTGLLFFFLWELEETRIYRKSKKWPKYTHLFSV